MHGGSIRAFRQIAVILGLATLTAPAAHARNIDCGDRVGQMLGDLNKLRSDSDAVRQACQESANDPYNLDTRYQRFPGGDCEQTYGVINNLGDRVEDKLELACSAFRELMHCQAGTQRQNQTCSQTANQRAGTHLRDAVAMLRKAQKILKRRVEHNERDVNEYARLGNFSPASVLGNPPSTITGEGMRYFRLAREQANSMQRGMDFIDKAGPVETKLNQYQARLNSMAATNQHRAQQLNRNASTITGNTQQAAQLAQAAAAGGEVFGQPAGPASSGSQAASAPRGYREQDFLMKEGEGDLSDDQFFDAMEGKPLGVDLAAKMPPDPSGKGGEENTKVGVNAKAGAGATPEGTGGPALAGASQIENGAAKLSAADFAAAPRNLASVAGAAGGGLSTTGASAPGFNGKAKAGAKDAGNEALANFESTNGPPKLIDRGGPSLRDMLKQRMSAGGASTRAMHEVLGGMTDLTGEAGAPGEAAGGQAGGEEQADRGDIKGIDSEPLFVRVRAAHLRYQKIHVTDL